MAFEITIPETITVHLGPPSSKGRNIKVPFIDYIKNVASSEIYPTWPENSIRANVLAQISFALNRIYTEHYRTRGYNFDITNSPRFDQAFVNGRNIFDTVSVIVDETFNDYVVREGEFIPLFTQYCSGKLVTCDGLSQWGTVDLADKGLSPLEILQTYYGKDIKIVEDAPIQNVEETYKGTPLKLGDSGAQVAIMQNALNRISKNYPNIKQIPVESIGYFGVSTQNAVKEFQKTFNLTQDGIVGKATWYKIVYVLIAVKKLAELDSEGIIYKDVSSLLNDTIEIGAKGIVPQTIQYYISVIALFNDKVQSGDVDGIFGPDTKESVESFQEAYNLPITGIVDRVTSDKLEEVYKTFMDQIPEDVTNKYFKKFPGRQKIIGTKNDNVLLMQQYLNMIAKVYKTIPVVDETGFFGEKTARAVSAYQEQFGIPVTGGIGPITWYSIIDTVDNIA